MGEKVQSRRGKGEPGEGRQLVNVVAVIVTMAVCDGKAKEENRTQHEAKGTDEMERDERKRIRKKSREGEELS